MTWILFGDPSLEVQGGLHCEPPTTYCQATANSAGTVALISYEGSTSISQGDFRLTASGGVPDRFALFYYGGAAVEFPFGAGYRCVGAGSLGIWRLNPAQPLDMFGDIGRDLDFTVPPAGAGGGKTAPGDTICFQFWHRDPAAGGAGFNLSSGLQATFCP